MAKKVRRMESKPTNEKRKGIVYKLMPLFLIVPIFAVLYMRADISKRRFIKHLAKQIPYLPGRYFA